MHSRARFLGQITIILVLSLSAGGMVVARAQTSTEASGLKCEKGDLVISAINDYTSEVPNGPMSPEEALDAFFDREYGDSFPGESFKRQEDTATSSEGDAAVDSVHSLSNSRGDQMYAFSERTPSGWRVSGFIACNSYVSSFVEEGQG